MGDLIDFRPRVISLGLSARDRAAIEAKIEELIAFLDEIDSDPDLEDDDPAGDPLEIDGEEPSDTGTPLLPLLPLYGVDHTRGPVNEHEGYRAWQQKCTQPYRQQRATKLMIASDGRERLFTGHPANGCLPAKED